MPQTLRDRATSVAHQAYAPYSHLSVGAALRSASGQVHVGCNVENASFTVGICAERAAIAAAVAAEGASFRLAAIAVTAFNHRGELIPIAPCGACRQALIEFGAEASVDFRDADAGWQTVVAADLLPAGFRFPSD